MKKRMVVGPPPLKYLKKYAKGGQLSGFEKAFAEARAKYGANGVFDYQGKSYNTKYKEELSGNTKPVQTTNKPVVTTTSSRGPNPPEDFGTTPTVPISKASQISSSFKKPTTPLAKDLINFPVVSNKVAGTNKNKIVSAQKPEQKKQSLFEQLNLTPEEKRSFKPFILDSIKSGNKQQIKTAQRALNTLGNSVRVDGNKDTALKAYNKTYNIQPKVQTPKPTSKQNTTAKPSSTDDTWVRKIMEFEATQGSAQGTGLPNFGYNSKGANAPKNIDEAVSMFKKEYLPKVQKLPPGLRERNADFLYNTGQNLDLYVVNKYLEDSTGKGISNRGDYKAKGPKSSSFEKDFSKELSAIRKLPIEQQVKLADEARDFYYRNINKVGDKPNPAYEKTWKHRVNMFNEISKKKYGGTLPKYSNGSTMNTAAGVVGGLGSIASMIPGVGGVVGGIASSIATPIMQAIAQGQNARSNTNKMYSSTQMLKKGGMIKRKDGTYSKRGLWDNIRANKGSGKKPTSQMLEQERKIKKMEAGGTLSGRADLTAYKGRLHRNGGIMVSPKGTPTMNNPAAEVEHNETRFSKGDSVYIFSDKLMI